MPVRRQQEIPSTSLNVIIGEILFLLINTLSTSERAFQLLILNNIAPRLYILQRLRANLATRIIKDPYLYLMMPRLI
jgi:hypothetical protein